MTVEATTGTPASPLERFVNQIIARRAEAAKLDWSQPGEPPALPEFKSNRLRWDAPGPANLIGGSPITIDELREQLPNRMMQYLLDKKDKSVLLVNVAAGGGKTHAAVQVVQKVASDLKWRSMWSGSRHNMFDQLQLVSGFDHGLWYHFQPMEALINQIETEEKEQMCRYAEQQRIWSTEKRYPSINLCESLCRDYMKKCPYRCQSKRKEKIIFTMHQHLSSGMAISNFKLVIVDENPLNAFVGTRRISFDDLYLKGATGPLAALLELFRQKVTEAMLAGAHKRIAGKELLDAIGTVLIDTYAQIEVNRNAIPVPPYIWSPELVTTVPAWFVMQMLDALVLEQQAHEAGWAEWAERVWIEKDGLHILERGEPWAQLPPKMIVLDATANPAFYRQIFGRDMTVYQPEIKRAGKLYQVTGRLNGKSTMTSKQGKITSQASEALEVSKEIATPYRAKDERVCVVCTKDLVQMFEREFGESNVGYFYNLRGTNEFEHAKCLIVVGGPSPDIRSVVQNAIALNPQRQRAYAPRDDDGNFQPLYHTSEREYRITKQVLDVHEAKAPWRALKGYWAEPELQAVYDQMREAELVQALHRSRMNVRETTVWLLTSVVTPEALDGIWDDPPAEAGFPAGIYWKQWLKIKAWLADQNQITYADIAEAVGVSEAHARKNKWLDAIQQHLGSEWEIATLKRAGRGGGKKAIMRAA